MALAGSSHHEIRRPTLDRAAETRGGSHEQAILDADRIQRGHSSTRRVTGKKSRGSDVCKRPRRAKGEGGDAEQTITIRRLRENQNEGQRDRRVTPVNSEDKTHHHLLRCVCRVTDKDNRGAHQELCQEWGRFPFSAQGMSSVTLRADGLKEVCQR